ncbi:hypothetical protein LTS08_007033 [Lithohypha guttulata]|nr:hypothetical protein LTS08_007033 [Lithohypha guttulata]
MQSYQNHESPLARARTLSNRERRDALLQGFRERIQYLGRVSTDPDMRRPHMAALVCQYIPALEDIGVKREEISALVQRLEYYSINDIGQLAKRFVDAFYLLKDRPYLIEQPSIPGGSWIQAISRVESLLRRTVSDSILLRVGRSPQNRHQDEFELREFSEDAGLLQAEELIDEEEQDWLMVERKEET